VTDLDVAVVGAGFSGSYAVHALRAAGLTVRAFEAGDGIGGTWFWNSYPGAVRRQPRVSTSYLAGCGPFRAKRDAVAGAGYQGFALGGS
jgi:cation diffusion facilitator CzcD-associated flavoprotein CzcO